MKGTHHTMSRTKPIFIALGFGLAGSFFLAGLYFGIMSWAEGFKAARAFFWSDRWLVIPIILGFGIQATLYAILKFRLYVPVRTTGPGGALMGASGTTSTVAMLACCVHHVTDVLPILGLTAAATFLGRYRLAFMWTSLGTTLVGITLILVILFRERRRAIQMVSHPIHSVETP
jgi:hypothetical protein